MSRAVLRSGEGGGGGSAPAGPTSMGEGTRPERSSADRGGLGRRGRSGAAQASWTSRRRRGCRGGVNGGAQGLPKPQGLRELGSSGSPSHHANRFHSGGSGACRRRRRWTAQKDFGGVEGARSAQGRLIKVTAEAPAVAWTARQSPARPLKRGGKRHAAGAQVLRTETEPSALHGARRRRSRPSGGDPRPREQTASVVRGPEPVDATTAGGGYGHPRAGVPPGTRVATKHIRSRSSTQPRLRSTVPRGKTTPPDPHREPAGAGHFRREPKVTETAWGRGAE